MYTIDPSPGKDWVNWASGVAPWKVIWAANWRASISTGAACTRAAARRVRAAEMVKVFILSDVSPGGDRTVLVEG